MYDRKAEIMGILLKIVSSIFINRDSVSDRNTKMSVLSIEVHRKVKCPKELESNI